MPKNDLTWLRFAYIAFGVLIAYVVWLLLHTIGVQTNWIERFDLWYVTASKVSSLAIGALSVFMLHTNEERREYLLASIGELRKVTWPSMLDTRRMTLVVCVVVAIFAVILTIFDLIWTKILGLIIT